MSRKIAIVTGSRADWGLLRPVACEIVKRAWVRVYACGQHIRQGTQGEIADAGFAISEIPHLSAIPESECAHIMGAAASRLHVYRPDIVLILGDRIEAFAAASAAHLSGIHVAHIHGGDVATGIADDSLRHAITKLAHLHFPGCLDSVGRVYALGEQNVFECGSPAADDLPKWEGGDDGDILMLHHPCGHSNEPQRHDWVLSASRAIGNRVRVLEPNHDPGREQLGSNFVPHLPRQEFIQRLAACRFLIGNSSSAYIECAAMGVPCVDVGDRQSGRRNYGNVIHCQPHRSAINQAIAKALELKPEPTKAFGDGDASRRIAKTLCEIDLESVPLRKRITF